MFDHIWNTPAAEHAPQVLPPAFSTVSTALCEPKVLCLRLESPLHYHRHRSPPRIT